MKARPQNDPLLPFWDIAPTPKSDEEIATLALKLHEMWKSGRLGGELMPEDVHPDLPLESDELAAYFTLGMTLNYQRNSYALWRSCTAAFHDAETRWVFDPVAVAASDTERLSEALTRHRVALQPNRHPQIWHRNACGLVDLASGSVRNVFESVDYDLGAVKSFLAEHRASFPYLCGPKISNYWLYVISTYMNWPTTNRESLSVAPDTHVIAASIRLGVMAHDENHAAQAGTAASRWATILEPTNLVPIDIHTPLWLWSRNGFPDVH